MAQQQQYGENESYGSEGVDEGQGEDPDYYEYD